MQVPIQSRTADPYRQYRDNQILMSSPAELIVMLFDGALRFVHRAAAAFERKKYDEVHFCLDRAQQIVIELSASLDFNQGELPQNLFSLYQYIFFQLLRADVGRKVEPLHEAEALLLSLRESWAKAGQTTGRSEK